MSAELDNAAWHALTTVHADRAEVVGGARRYPTDVCPFNAVDVLDAAAWADLAALAGPSGTAVLFRAGDMEVPDDWAVEFGGGVWWSVGSLDFGGQLAIPFGGHSHDANKAGEITFDYTSYDLDLLFAVRLRSK